MANSGGATVSPLQTLLNEMSGSTAPTTANAQTQFNLGQEQLGQAVQGTNAQLAYNNAMSGYQSQNLGLSEQGLGIQATGLAQQGAQNQAQQGFEEQQYGISQQQYPEQQAEAALAYQNSLRQTQGSQAIGGTQNTVGGQADVSTLGQNYAFQKQDIARNQALSQLGQKSEESGFGFSQEQLTNAQNNLALSAKANGLSEQQMLTMLQYGNAQTAQGGLQNIIQLLAGQGTNALGQASNAGGNLSSIGFASGVNALAGIGG